MLHIHFGDVEGMIDYIDSYFNNNFEREWFDDPLVWEMVRDVDKSEVISGSAIDSPFLGPISPRELSGGVKTLICMLFEPENVYYATACGDNCGKWMVEIGKRHDVTISLNYLMMFRTPEEKYVGGMNAICDNNGMKIDNMMEFFDAYNDLVRRGVID